MKLIRSSFLLVTCLLGLSGCGKVIDWSKANFDQGKEIKKDTRHAHAYVRSATIYNQFATAGIFDALWLSDNVRATYADMHSFKRGKSDEQRKIFLRRQLEENNHFISFYVLSLYEKPLGETDVDWTLFLRIGGNNYRPIELKTVDLSPEYRAIFGKNYTRFKEAYLVKFDANDIDDQPLITRETTEIALHFRSLEKEASLVWHLEDGIMVNTKG